MHGMLCCGPRDVRVRSDTGHTAHHSSGVTMVLVGCISCTEPLGATTTISTVPTYLSPTQDLPCRQRSGRPRNYSSKCTIESINAHTHTTKIDDRRWGGTQHTINVQGVHRIKTNLLLFLPSLGPRICNLSTKTCYDRKAQEKKWDTHIHTPMNERVLRVSRSVVVRQILNIENYLTLIIILRAPMGHQVNAKEYTTDVANIVRGVACALTGRPLYVRLWRFCKDFSSHLTIHLPTSHGRSSKLGQGSTVAFCVHP